MPGFTKQGEYMQIKNNDGTVIANIEFQNGFSIDELSSFLNKKTKTPSCLQSVEESEDKKKIVFRFQQGDPIFYNLVSKTFVCENGTKVKEHTLKNIKFELPYLKLNAPSQIGFWHKISDKATVPWIKTFFKIVDIWANYYYPQKTLEFRAKIQRLAEDKSFFDNIESLSKVLGVQNLDYTNLIGFYSGVLKIAKSEDNKIKFNAKKLDSWFLKNIDKQTSSKNQYNLARYVEDYVKCSVEMKNLFQYVFEQYGGVIALGIHADEIKKLIGFGYDPKRLVDYIYRDLYNQGLNVEFDDKWSDDCVATLYDYAKMNIEMETEFEKYPRYLATFHDITVRNYEIKLDDILKKKFAKEIKRLKSLKIDQSDEQHCVVLPKNPNDLVKEGQNLCHCVESYIKDMADGRTIIVFLRKKNNPTQSLVTMEINKNNEGKYNIVQAKAKNNKNPQPEEASFIKKYEQYLSKLN